MLKHCLMDYQMMITHYIPLEKARKTVFDDYALTNAEKEKLMVQMLKILEDKVRMIRRWKRKLLLR